MRASAHKAESLKDTTDQGVISPYAQPLLARLILDPLAVGTLVPLVMAAQVGPQLGFQAVGEVSGSEPAPTLPAQPGAHLHVHSCLAPARVALAMFPIRGLSGCFTKVLPLYLHVTALLSTVRIHPSLFGAL